MERQDDGSSSSEEEKAPVPHQQSKVRSDSNFLHKKIVNEEVKKENVNSDKGSDRDKNGASYSLPSPQYACIYDKSDDFEVEIPLKKQKMEIPSLNDVKKEKGSSPYKFGRTSPSGTVWLDGDSDAEKHKNTATADDAKEERESTFVQTPNYSPVEDFASEYDPYMSCDSNDYYSDGMEYEYRILPVESLKDWAVRKRPRTPGADSECGRSGNSDGEEECNDDEGGNAKTESEWESSEEYREVKPPPLKSVKTRKPTPMKRTKPESEGSDSSDGSEMIRVKTKKIRTMLILKSDDSDDSKEEKRKERKEEDSNDSDVVRTKRKTVEEKTSRPVISESSEDEVESFLNSAKILLTLKRMASRWTEKNDPEPNEESRKPRRKNRNKRRRRRRRRRRRQRAGLSSDVAGDSK